MTQRFLSKVIFLLDNVEFIFGFQYVSQCKVKGNPMINKRFQEIDFKAESDKEYAITLVMKGDKKCQNIVEFMGPSNVADLCAQTENTTFTVSGSVCELERIPFDVLIGSDGLYSNVRSSLNISTHDIHTFDVSNTIYASGMPREAIPKITVKPKLEQVALIINFKRTAENDCPDTAIDEDTGDNIGKFNSQSLFTPKQIHGNQVSC